MTRTPAAPQAFNSLAQAAKGGAWTPQVVAVLNRLLASDVLLVDTRGSVLAAAPARSSIDPMRVLAAATGQDPSLVAHPVHVAGGTVALLGCACDSADAGLLDFAASLIAVDLRARLKVLRAKEDEATAAFLEALNAASPDPATAGKLRAVGLEVERPFRILAGAVGASEEQLAAIPWNLHALLAKDSRVPSRMAVRGRLVTLVPDSAAVPERAKRLREQLRRLNHDAAVGISQRHTGVSGLRIAHAEAVRAAGLGPGIHQGESLDVITITLLNQTTPEAVAVATGFLAPVTAYDQDLGGQLAVTLRVWLENDRSTAAAAKALFVHRNTLLYRLKKAEELIGQRLDATGTIVNLSIALRITARPD
jgi:purine catabolism regulator